MAEIDAFATTLLEEAKWFLEKAAGADDEGYREAHLHAAIFLSFSALEAHVNSICEEFSHRPELSAHEKALLLERDIKLENGEFKSFGFKMARLEDRMAFLHYRFSGKALDKNAVWWQSLKGATDVRNKLTHPKGAQALTITLVKSAITSIIDTIDALYLAIYKKKFPAASRGLQSRLTF